MKPFLSFLAAALLALSTATRAQDPTALKTSAPTASFIIKVQDAQARNATPFTDKINAIEGITVMGSCKSKNKPLWYVLIGLDKHRYPVMDGALEELEKQGIVFKRINQMPSSFGTICDNN